MSRRFRYRLSTLFLLTLVVAFSASVYGWRLRATLNHQRAIQAIADKGGFVFLDRAGDHVDIRFTGPLPGELCGQINLLAGSGATIAFDDHDISLIDHIRRVRTVNFAGSGVSSTAIRQFRASHPHCKIEE